MMTDYKFEIQHDLLLAGELLFSGSYCNSIEVKGAGQIFPSSIFQIDIIFGSIRFLALFFY